MPDEPAATATPDPVTQEPKTEPGNPADKPLGEAGQKALDAMKERARKAEAELKDLKPLAARAQELEDAQRSELEKLTSKATKAEQAKAEAEARLLRYEVAQTKEVPAKLVPLLTAADREGLEAQADLILENAKAAPAPEFDGGARQPAPEPKTPEQSHNETLLRLAGLTPNT